MTYRYYIQKNRISDNKETYANYCSNYHPDFAHMSAAMKKQIVEKTYGMRFAIQF